ncbi:uncharacterized protein LOC111195203 isoform X1 [Astyanax mexicanus]|uniref:uncharacterized protein LOC111195203 isoform X1 n=2 Tax=Astyanax mexicanus TaxID=7994 RepID=UPI000BBDB09C|nr:uncharacterized protein LOC111195203 isoform X1 [Astyanax mexicanus]
MFAMEAHWIAAIESSLRKEADPKVKRSIQVLSGQSQDAFMSSHLHYLEECGLGNFVAMKKRHANHFQWRCERASHCKGKSTGDPQKTRANSCGAYVSFTFVNKNCYDGCIIRLMSDHSGHDPNSPLESTVNRIHPGLTDYIYTLIQQGHTNAEILLCCKDWSDTQSQSYLKDRRYHVAPDDINFIRKSYNAHTHMDLNDCVSVDRLIKSKFKDDIIYYQPLSHSEKQALIIVFSTPWQRDQLKNYGSDMIYLDATYKGITQYGFAFYAVIIKSSQGRGVPVAFFILSEESTENLSICLQKLQECVNPFQPRCVMVDRDLKEINAVQKVFPHTRILLCWFHVLQAVHRWMQRQDECKKQPALKNEVIRAMIALKQCATEADFEERSNQVVDSIDELSGTTTISNYLKMQWFQHSKMWANFGRRVFHQNSETNNLAERFFFSMKYQFLQGYANRRVDDLLHLLSEKVVTYYSYLEELYKAGRITELKKPDMGELVSRMKYKGLHDKVVFQSAGQILVPSETSEGKCYFVDLITMLCECDWAERGNLCKHIALAKHVCEERDVDIDECRRELACCLSEQGSYEWDGNYLIVHHRQSFGVVNLQTKHCTCLASSLKEMCVP